MLYRKGSPGESDEMPLANVHYPTYYETFKEMWALYDDKIELKLGLEFGMQVHTIEKYEKQFARFPFDFIILSVHENLAYSSGSSMASAFNAQSDPGVVCKFFSASQQSMQSI